MKKNVLMFAIAVALSCGATVFTLGSSASSSCLTQCRVAYDKCVRTAQNPGGLNQCGKAFKACSATCK
jgi:hypothetical protein